jgi:hypothetical protein
MVFITAVTSVTKIKRYPSLCSRYRHRRKHTCIPTTIGPDPPPKVVTVVTEVTVLDAGSTRAALK